MAITTAAQLKQDSADFADQFNAEDPKKTEQTEDQAFGLAGGEGEGTGTGADAETGGGEGAGIGAAAEVAAQTGAGQAEEQAGALSEQEKALREREAQLAAREEELKAKEAALASAGTGEHQTSSDGEKDSGAKGDGAGEGEGGSADDVEKLLAEDFGAEFVDLMKRLIVKTVGASVTEGLSPLQNLVQSVIRDLQTERDTNHFKAIAKAHADFNDIVESTGFQEWLAGHTGDEKAQLDRIVASGSADEIIDMLTKFKDAQKATTAATGTEGGDSGTGDGNDDALDAAEGVRSSGLHLPTDPPSDSDYERAWAES